MDSGEDINTFHGVSIQDIVVMYRFLCDCGEWFDRKDALTKYDRVEGVLLGYIACPFCAGTDTHDEVRCCETCSQAAVYDDEEHCEDCLREARYPASYTPYETTIQKLELWRELV